MRILGHWTTEIGVALVTFRELPRPEIAINTTNLLHAFSWALPTDIGSLFGNFQGLK